MADLAELIVDARKDLKWQSKEVQAAKKEADKAKKDWQEAKGRHEAPKKEIWQDAVKREEAERENKKEIEARLQKLIDKMPSAGSKRPAAEEAGGTLRSVRRRGLRTFASGEAVNPEAHYHATTRTETKLNKIIDGQHYALLIDHRQAGKSTACLASATRNKDTMYLYLRPVLAHESLWEVLHQQLRREDPQRFPMPDCPNAQTFEDCFNNLSGIVNVIIDEANNLETVEASTLQIFLDRLRQLKHTRLSGGSGLGALIMVGTENLLKTLRKGNKTSPFNQALRTSPEKIKLKPLTKMLQDWIDDCDGQILASGADEYAERIYEVCRGHAGLTGACCLSLKMEAEASLRRQEQYSVTKFDEFLTWSMPGILSGLRVYETLLEDIKTKLSPAQIADLSQVIFDGCVPFDIYSEIHKELLDRGIVIVEDDGGRKQAQLIIAAPLLASATLRKHREPLPSSNVEPLTVDQAKDAWELGRWIIRQVIKYLDYVAATKPEACITKEVASTQQASEMTFQAQFGLIANSLYGYIDCLTNKDLPSQPQAKKTMHKLVWEARSGPAGNRLDLLIRNGHAVRQGFELLIGRDQKALDEYIQRAHKYAARHKRKVWIVNFCLDDSKQPRSQLSFPKSYTESQVQIADVQVCLPLSKAYIRYSVYPDQAKEEVLLASGFDLCKLSALWV